MNNCSTLRMSSHLGEISGVIDNIIKLLTSSGADKQVSFDVRLCLEEALINAIKHGNKNNKELPIIVNYCMLKDKFWVSVQDSGEGFDHKKIPDPTGKENLLKTSGRGVYLIKYLMDEVLFNKKGNKITMTKYLKAPKFKGRRETPCR